VLLHASLLYSFAQKVSETRLQFTVLSTDEVTEIKETTASELPAALAFARLVSRKLAAFFAAFGSLDTKTFDLTDE